MSLGARAAAILDDKGVCVDECGGVEGLFNKILERVVRVVGLCGAM